MRNLIEDRLATFILLYIVSMSLIIYAASLFVNKVEYGYHICFAVLGFLAIIIIIVENIKAIK